MRSISAGNDMSQELEREWEERLNVFLEGFMLIDCERCEGLGRVNINLMTTAPSSEPCPRCKGYGTEEKEREALKIFFRKELAKTHQEGYYLGRNHIGPMGVSQWREHGKKYKYWEYFEKQIREAGFREAVSLIPDDACDITDNGCKMGCLRSVILEKLNKE